MHTYILLFDVMGEGDKKSTITHTLFLFDNIGLLYRPRAVPLQVKRLLSSKEVALCRKRALFLIVTRFLLLLQNVMKYCCCGCPLQSATKIISILELVNIVAKLLLYSSIFYVPSDVEQIGSLVFATFRSVQLSRINFKGNNK